jgi:hypothetical protein
VVLPQLQLQQQDEQGKEVRGPVGWRKVVEVKQLERLDSSEEIYVEISLETSLVKAVCHQRGGCFAEKQCLQLDLQRQSRVTLTPRLCTQHERGQEDDDGGCNRC